MNRGIGNGPRPAAGQSRMGRLPSRPASAHGCAIAASASDQAGLSVTSPQIQEATAGSLDTSPWLPDSRLGELCRVAASTGNDPYPRLAFWFPSCGTTDL